MPSEHPPTPATGPVLSAADLVKRYPGASENALNGLSLQVDGGQIVGLLGPNGAGKTTAVSILSTLMRPSAGRLSIMGRPVTGHLRPIRQAVGLAPQEIALYETLSVQENLTYFGRMYGLKGEGLKARVADCLAAVGLTAQADRPVAVFSGGMKRRANLATAIVHAPRLLFLDEPTVGVDAQSRALIMDLLRSLQRDGTAMVYTTHYMEEVEALCDRVVIMDAGRIIAEGAPADLRAGHPDVDSLGELFLKLTGRFLRD